MPDDAAVQASLRASIGLTPERAPRRLDAGKQSRAQHYRGCHRAEHDLNAYLQLLKRDGTMTLVGAPSKPAPIAAFNLLFGRKSLAGSAIGGLRETQEMLDFCGANGIVSEIEKIPFSRSTRPTSGSSRAT